ncbi:MAG: HesA/MoeB/ThiF family protein [Tepidimonas sp.]|uniref:HesA/MoeB/ThiF family protein n=1 Tax=Tepidimonas sp. TaxID=2002775 RepID=UPI00405527E7
MTDEQLLRYSRHILLDEIGIEGQQRLLNARVVVVGAGGLGSPVALYLASAGVGHITLVDHDTVDATNLQRQIAHDLSRVGLPKALSAQVAMHAINPEVRIAPLTQRADDALLDTVLPGADVLLDCTDNFHTRHLINRASVRHGVPLVSGAAIRFDGQLSVYDPRDPHSPCYACLFPETEGLQETRCATMGVFAPLVGIIGTMQAAEALKLIVGLGSRLVGRLLMLDGRGLAFTEVQLARRPDCPVCGFRRQAT